MKKIAPIFLLGGLAVMTTASIVVGSLAWFSAKARITDTNDPIAAVTEGAYFAYGDGSAEKPFGITKPRHLYNLSWLQYLNHFNKKVDNTGKIIPTYFVLGDDVIGEGMVIPPIGDATHPFVGNFNGKGHVISDFVISNNPSEFVVKPAAVSSYTPSEIVGLFGVVGTLESDTTTSYDTSTNMIINTGISGLTIKSNTSNTLAGIVAGYVNGTVDKVAVSDSTINIGKANAAAISGIGTSNLSDYSLVGYCTEQHKSTLTKVTDTIYDITTEANVEFNATDDGNVQGWGGSINMKEMFQRLLLIQNNAATNQTYTTMTTTTHAADGTTTSTNTDYTAYRYSPNNQVGNFSYIDKNNSYLYLSGGKRQVDNYYSYYTHTGYPITDGTNYLCFNGSNILNVNDSDAASTCTLWTFETYGSQYYIYTKYNNTNYYLRCNNGALEITTARNNTCLWSTYTQDNLKAIYFEGASTDYVIDIISGVWCLTDPSNNDGYYIVRDGSGHYVGPNDGNYATSVSRENAVKFRYDSSAHGYYDISNTSNYLGYYYRRGMFSTTRYPVTVSSTTSAYYRLVGNNGNLTGNLTGTGYLRAFNKNGDTAYTDNIYVQYNANQSNSPWYYTTNRNNGTTMTIEEITPPAFSIKTLDSAEITDPPHEGPDSYLDTDKKTSKMVYTATDTTYFPLNVVKDGGTASSSITNGNYLPTDGNTGYVISGTEVLESSADEPSSIIRVSEYATSKIANSYSASDGGIVDSKIYTYTESFAHTTIANDTFDYQKYNDSKATLYDKVLKNSSNVYGIHFLDAAISKDAIVEATNISILGVSHSKYQLPVNAIDFNLKEKGYINFFAGTYYNGSKYGRNNSFFSLNMVIRNGSSAITDIKEIKNVYANSSKKNYSYAYEFTDGTFSKPYRFDGNKNKYELSPNDTGTIPFEENNYLPSLSTYTANYGYAPIFNTSRITNKKDDGTFRTINNDALYYFEIPMNDGEYCLGSVDGGVGGYLVYLDIGANASKTQRTTIIEHFINEVKVFEYPLGVALLPTNQAGANTFDETNTVCVAIYASYSGNLSVERTSNDVEVTRTDNTKAKPTYASEEVTALHDPGGTSILPEVVPKTSNTKEVFRLQYYDYNVNLDETVKTIITDTSTNGGTFVREVKQYVKTSDGWDERTGTNIKIYSSTTGIKYDLEDVEDRESGTLSFTSTTTTVLLSVKYVVDGDTTFTDSVELNLVVDANNLTGTYYIFDDYTLAITATGNDIVVKVVKLGSRKIIIGDTTVESVGQEIRIVATPTGS